MIYQVTCENADGEENIFYIEADDEYEAMAIATTDGWTPVEASGEYEADFYAELERGYAQDRI